MSKDQALLGYLSLSEEVKAALSAGRPVVALESTVLAHGLPWPDNLEVALEMEATLRKEQVVPATVAVVKGRLCVGLEGATLEKIARGRFVKAGVADLGPLLATSGNGATTVSATMFAAARAGVPIFATGGIGGVHRGDSGDISSDMTALGSYPVGVVSAGAKSVLELPRTLEYLETLGVPVIGYGTNELPAFYVQKSRLPLEHRVDTAGAAAALLHAHFSLGFERAVLLANPIPTADALDEAQVEEALATALRSATERRVHGKALTPFLLAAIALETGRQSVRANRALLINNARVAAEIAVALAALRA